MISRISPTELSLLEKRLICRRRKRRNPRRDQREPHRKTERDQRGLLIFEEEGQEDDRLEAGCLLDRSIPLIEIFKFTV